MAGEWKGREGGGNGGPRGWWAAGVRGVATDVLGGGPARADAGMAAKRPCCWGSGTDLAAGVLFGSAVPWIRARHCRAKIGGATEPCHVTGRDFGRRHVSPLSRHHA